jgi:DNA-binding NarL/FixJ family response regulator
MPSVWLIEDNPAFRRAAVRALEAAPEICAVRAFTRCEEAISAMEAGERPEVILLDVGLPGIDGIEGIRRIKGIDPEASVVMLTVFEDDEKIFRALCAGACGYLLKSEPMRTVITAIEQAVAGGSPMNPRVARRVVEMFARLAPPKKDYGLSGRESAVLELMVEGLAKKQFADRLQINQHTADYVIRCIYRKLHVNCMSAAVSVALRERLI